MTKTQKLREEIDQEIKRRKDPYRHDDGKLHYYSLTDQILKVLKEAGLAFVVEDAELPKPSFYVTYMDGQQDMLDNHWEKTEEIEV